MCVPDGNRHNLYNAIHKTLRFGHCRLLAQLGSHDFADGEKTSALLQALRDMIGFGRAHLEGENRYIHPALEARRPGATAHAFREHLGHEQGYAELESLIRAVEVATRERKPLAGLALYHRYALFAADDLAHMYEEETEVLGALHDAFSDSELKIMEERAAAAVPFALKLAMMALFMPALNHVERADVLAREREALSGEAFSALLASAVKPALSPQDYAATMGALTPGAA